MPHCFGLKRFIAIVEAMTVKHARDYITKNHLNRVLSMSMAMPVLYPFALLDGLPLAGNEIYRNETQTHWAAINVPAGIFRIWDEKHFIDEIMEVI